MYQKLVTAMADMKEREATDLAEKMLASGQDPLSVMEQCRSAMEIVGRRFEEGRYFLPELIMAGEMMKEISRMAEPYLKEPSPADAGSRGRVIMGSVQGDIHDIGKDMVSFLLEVNGFEVHDLGVDISPGTFISKIKELNPRIVGMSALLTTVLNNLKATVRAIEKAGLRDRVKIMVGGCAVDEGVRDFAGADAYGKDAVAALNLAKSWVDQKSTSEA